MSDNGPFYVVDPTNDSPVVSGPYWDDKKAECEIPDWRTDAMVCLFDDGAFHEVA